MKEYANFKKYNKSYIKMMSLTDRDFRIKMINKSYRNSGDTKSNGLSEISDASVDTIIRFHVEDLKKINDTLINGILEIVNENHNLFMLADSYDNGLFSRILNRKMGAKEYYSYLSGEKSFLIKNDKKYRIKKPNEFDKILNDYNKNHLLKVSVGMQSNSRN